MRNLIKVTMTITLLAIGASSFAQQQMPQRTPEQRAQRQTKWMQKNLALTPEQNNRVYNILLYRATEVDDKKGMPPGPDKRAEKRQLKRDTDAELKAALTGEQYQRYAQHMEEMKVKRQNRKAALPY